MRAGVWEGIGTIACRSWQRPRPGSGEVLVRVRYCGFCGTDPHIIEGVFAVGPPPQVIGHEVAGEVVEVGAGVRGFAAGDRVACNLFAYCGGCEPCRKGYENHCRRKSFSAQGFAEYAVYRPEQLFLLPEDVSLSVGAFLEPVATCLHAVEMSELRPGEHVAVLGAGPLGLIVAQLARAAGAATVTVSEPRTHNRELALALGADRAVDPQIDRLRAAAPAGRRGFDVVFEVAGAPSAAATALDAVGVRGRVMIVGVFRRDVGVTVRPYHLYEKEITIRGAYAASQTFERALDLLPRLQLEPLVSVVAPLERIADVYAEHRAGEHVKVLFAP
jgi:L-iditol 2-dehydrogenase